MEEVVIQQQRSLAETPTYSVASVVTVMVFVCLLVERSIYRFGKWLKKTRRKALFASLEKIKEELMLLGLISLLLAQSARGISEICVNSSLFTSQFYICSEKDFGTKENVILESTPSPNKTEIPRGLNSFSNHQCGEGREPFVSYEGLEQLHRFLFVLGITHVLYSCLAVALAMSKIYSWRKWENQAGLMADANLQAKKNKVMRRQSTFIFHHTSHPWSRNRFLVWMLCFLRQFRSSIQRSDYLALRLGFISVGILLLMPCMLVSSRTYLPKLTDSISSSTFIKHKLPLTYNFHKYMVRSMEDEFQGILGISWPLWGYAIVCIFVNIHGLNIYFWLSFIPAIVSIYVITYRNFELKHPYATVFLLFFLSDGYFAPYFFMSKLVMLVGTKLQHVVSSLALEIVEQTGPTTGTQVKPRDDLFWFRKPMILLRLIQFIIFQNAFEMATFLWSLWGLKERSCFMKNHLMIVIRLTSGVLVQFWCSYSTAPLNVIVTQMGSRCKKALIAESVRDSLHSWCKRVKERSKRDSVHSHATRSVCSLDTTIDERDEITVASGTLSRSSSLDSLHQVTIAPREQPQALLGTSEPPQHEYTFRVKEYLSGSIILSASQPSTNGDENDEGDRVDERVDTLLELFQKT